MRVVFVCLVSLFGSVMVYVGWLKNGIYILLFFGV